MFESNQPPLFLARSVSLCLAENLIEVVAAVAVANICGRGGETVKRSEPIEVGQIIESN